jgi:hypothetical protein
MTSQPVALLLATLGVVPSHPRPQVSDGNPFSEAQFKTLQYRPDFPARFGAYEDAETFCRRFFPWYNLEHRHGALGLMTPHDIHYGLAVAKRQQRAEALRAAYYAHPERFPRGVPTAAADRAWIIRPRRRWPSPRQRGVTRDGCSQISDADCLIRLNNFRRANLAERARGGPRCQPGGHGRTRTTEAKSKTPPRGADTPSGQ